MRISVHHRTLYRYDVPVYLEPHIFRLRPRVNSAQRLLAFDIEITPIPAGTTECLDQDGNLALNAWFNAATSELAVESRFTVEMLRTNPFDYILAGPALRLPLSYTDPLCAALAPYRDDKHVAAFVRQYARSAAETAQWNTLAFLSALSSQIHQTFRRVVRPDGPPWPSDQTLNMMEGSCRDLAVLFCDACRAMGIAARFVSGYECASATTQAVYACVGRGLSARHRLARVRSCPRTGGVQRTCSGCRRIHSRPGIAGGWMVFRSVAIADGDLDKHAG